MALKLVLISPSGTLEKDGLLNNADIAKLGKLIGDLAKVGVKVALWSNRRWTVNKVKPLEDHLSEQAGAQVQYVGMADGMPARQRANSIAPILEKFGVALHESILVGAREEDMQAGVNNKLLLLRPAWYGGNLAYGFELQSIEALGRFCMLFGIRQHPFFWQIKTQRVNMNALGPFSTFIPAYQYFGADAIGAAKHNGGTQEFWQQMVTSTLYFSGLMHKVNLIAVYPGHSSVAKDKAFYGALDVLGKCFNKPFMRDLLVRHESAVKSTEHKASDRKFASQVNTIRVNRYPMNGGKIRKGAFSLKDRCVLIVDDICTSGRSLDTARAYFEAAGATTILFSWLKTINTDFYSMAANVQIKPYDANVLGKEPSTTCFPYTQHIVDVAAAKEIDDLLKRFQAWAV